MAYVIQQGSNVVNWNKNKMSNGHQWHWNSALQQSNAAFAISYLYSSVCVYISDVCLNS